MKSNLGDKIRLLHILDAIDEIQNYTESTTFESFSSNSMIHFATIKQLEVIGEASNKLSSELRKIISISPGVKL
jgi:uncharacterized protein with HEPN domain